MTGLKLLYDKKIRRSAVRVEERFLKYISFDSKSDTCSKTCPSTPSQLEFAKYLKKELEDIGLVEVCLDENGYLTAKLPSNVVREVVTIGFISHMDTAPDMSGKVDNPKIVRGYNGGDIVLDKGGEYILSPEDFPELLKYKGKDIITTDGTTLLGADDKAGLAEIITAMEHLLANPEIEHGEIMVGFTPDEEIGRGANLFDVDKFGAKYAYTMDGGEVGELEYENFNAAGVKINIAGRNVHPGSAKGKMINALSIAMEIDSMLPKTSRPEYTEKYEGFYHLVELKGEPESAYMEYIVRDHDKVKFEDKKIEIKRVVEHINSRYGQERVKLEVEDQYYNMREKIEPVMEVIEVAKRSMEELGIEPKVKPIRGGTDGARLSYMGLPCPNIFTGGHNFHGRFEYIPIQSMKKAVEVIVRICENYAKL